ncbi:universal stress protein [Sinomicrobium pectinilyticum]|uniref:Universal stress protein n=1 Tax=Sinomicrobium pectinilyticum TaxID=1084421 RepID=A0A3N0EC15_SINP1|nr:universal stress protein [Sinomicrobium pectinilyticum]RNL85381.1 universal stress protein [Sinomicrobium pectinilyticum]
MKKILLPTDFSDNAWTAIVYGLNMFRDEACDFYVLHTYLPAFYEVDYHGMIEDTLSGLDLTLERIHREFPNKKHRFYPHSDFDQLTDEVLDITKDKGIDLIIMGTKGATGARRILFGSNTVFVMRKATVPVLAVPDRYTYSKIERILFPTDYLRHFKKEELRPLVDIAKRHGAGMMVLHVEEDLEWTENEQQNKEKLQELLTGIDFEFTVVRDTDISAAIQDHIRDNHYDMLVMMHRKHSFLGRLLRRQNIANIGFNLEIPFLVLQGAPVK